MESQIEPGEFRLRDDISVPDIYVTVTSRWEPGPWRSLEIAPLLGETFRRIDTNEHLADRWTRRFPFTPGGER